MATGCGAPPSAALSRMRFVLILQIVRLLERTTETAFPLDSQLKYLLKHINRQHIFKIYTIFKCYKVLNTHRCQ